MNLKNMINGSDMVLIGIGECFQEQFVAVKATEEKNQSLFDEYERKKYIDSLEKDETIDAYNILAKLLEGKNYFVVTLCDDDKIYRSNLRTDRIVAPCGTYSKLQCENVCSEEIYNVDDYIAELEKGEKILCPKCGARLVMNRISNRKYSEEGYLKKWELYMKWLQGTLNRNVVIIELGVGMKYPSVIRWPFEKVAFINQKARFIRVHDYLYQLTEDLKEKGTSIEENPIVFLRNQIV
ncbi:MAG: hypothetical protein IKW30_04320 [Lachnospiraceae bacterium]|nr:hypothetical protein [Lachnospiraceae bacterium]